MNPTTRAAALRTATDPTITNARAVELRAQFREYAAEGLTPTSTPEELRTALAVTDAVEQAERGPKPRSPFNT